MRTPHDPIGKLPGMQRFGRPAKARLRDQLQKFGVRPHEALASCSIEVIREQHEVPQELSIEIIAFRLYSGRESKHELPPPGVAGPVRVRSEPLRR